MKKNIVLLAVSALVLALAPTTQADIVTIDNLPVFLGTEPQNSSSVSDTGILAIDAVAAGHTLTITATATYGGGAAEVAQTNGGLCVTDPGSINRFGNDATIIFDMVIKNDLDADVTSAYDIKITDLYAKASASTSLAILVDGAHTYSFASAVESTLWAQGTVPQYTILDPSNVSFLAVGNDGFGLKFNYNGIKMDINPVPEPATMSLLAIVGMGLMVKRRRRRA